MAVEVLPRFTDPAVVPPPENPQFFRPKPPEQKRKVVRQRMEPDGIDDEDFRPRWWPAEGMPAE